MASDYADEEEVMSRSRHVPFYELELDDTDVPVSEGTARRSTRTASPLLGSLTLTRLPSLKSSATKLATCKNGLVAVLLEASRTAASISSSDEGPAFRGIG